MNRYSYPTGRKNHPTKIREYGLGTDCIIMFGVMRSSAIKTYHELLWYPDTYDFARGLSLGNHSSSL